MGCCQKILTDKKVSRDLFLLNLLNTKMGDNHSGQIHARNHERITRILYLISTVWHLPTHFLVFSSFLDLTLTSHLTHKYVFLRNRKITFTDIFEVVNF